MACCAISTSRAPTRKRRSGQSSPTATHLIKVAAQAALGQRPHMAIFGTDFPTPDGTGVRDYIHVTDLVEAHALLLQYLRDGGAPVTMNCGYGRGYSVREVIETVKAVARRLQRDRGAAPRRRSGLDRRRAPTRSGRCSAGSRRMRTSTRS